MLHDILNAPLDELLGIARERFSVGFEPLAVGNTRLEVLQITDMERYVESIVEQAKDQPLTLPFWAKVWPSNLLLSHFIHTLPPKGSMLEIGAGIGVVGLFAASHGFDVTITDMEENALLFARINVLHNGLERKASVRFVDFTATSLEERFDWIVGCEILYKEEVYRPLVKFLLRHLAHTPEAEIVLAMDHVRKARKFFQLAEREFLMQEKTIGFRSAEPGGERRLCTIYRLKPKKRI